MKEVSTPSASNSFNMAKPCESSATLEISFGFKPSRAAQVSALPALPPPSTFNEALRTLSSGFGNPSTVARKSTAVIPNPTCTTCQNQNNNKHIYRERGGGRNARRCGYREEKEARRRRRTFWFWHWNGDGSDDVSWGGGWRRCHWLRRTTSARMPSQRRGTVYGSVRVRWVVVSGWRRRFLFDLTCFITYLIFHVS